MTVTLELPEELALRLNALSSEERNKFAVAVFSEVMEPLQADEADFEEACAGIAEGLRQAEAGLTISFEEYLAEAETKREQRRMLRRAA